MSPPLHRQTLTQLARGLRQAEFDPLDITRACLQHIAEWQPRLQAFVDVYTEQALAQAEQAAQRLAANPHAGPLCGIPFAAKDLFDVAGMPTQAGCSVLAQEYKSRHARVIEQLLAAGMVLLGKTHTVQFAYGGVGVNHDTGTPWNPWDLHQHHVPGGSSSGSAVAVSSGMAPLALGTDTGGSVRIPASLCGIVGLKTTVGQLSRAGVYPLSQSLDSVGPLTRCVEDAALCFQHLQGVDFADQSTLSHHPLNVLRELKAGVQGLRLAFANNVFWDDADSEVSAAVRATADVFTRLGAEVSETEFNSATHARDLNPSGFIIAAEAYANNRRWLLECPQQLDPIVATRMHQGDQMLAWDYLQAQQTWQALRALAQMEFAEFDALLVPTTALPALPLAVIDQNPESYAHYNRLYLRNTTIGNILNFCGVSVPCGMTCAGLPIGLMIYAPSFREDMALRVAYAYEQASAYSQCAPQLV